MARGRAQAGGRPSQASWPHVAPLPTGCRLRLGAPAPSRLSPFTYLVGRQGGSALPEKGVPTPLSRLCWPYIARCGGAPKGNGARVHRAHLLAPHTYADLMGPHIRPFMHLVLEHGRPKDP